MIKAAAFFIAGLLGTAAHAATWKSFWHNREGLRLACDLPGRPRKPAAMQRSPSRVRSPSSLSCASRLRQTADIFIPICLLAGALLVKANDPAPIQYLRNVTFDTYQRLKPRVYNPDLPVRIAAIDEQSLKKFGQWPWPRTTMAMLINRLNDFAI